jgi:hypothetical protein
MNGEDNEFTFIDHLIVVPIAITGDKQRFTFEIA